MRVQRVRVVCSVRCAMCSVGLCGCEEAGRQMRWRGPADGKYLKNPFLEAESEISLSDKLQQCKTKAADGPPLLVCLHHAASPFPHCSSNSCAHPPPHLPDITTNVPTFVPPPPPPPPPPTNNKQQQTQHNKVEHRNRACSQRLKALTQAASKRFHAFSNEHCRATYVEAAPGEGPNDRNDRAIRVVAKWCAPAAAVGRDRS